MRCYVDINYPHHWVVGDIRGGMFLVPMGPGLTWDRRAEYDVPVHMRRHRLREVATCCVQRLGIPEVELDFRTFRDVEAQKNGEEDF